MMNVQMQNRIGNQLLALITAVSERPGRHTEISQNFLASFWSEIAWIKSSTTADDAEWDLGCKTM